MLQKLVIKNYAIIDHIEVDFSDRINIITGETGAGKSILVGALSLILGQRADMKTLFDKNKKCIVEGIFDLKSYQIQPFFKKNDLDYDDLSIIRREINPVGKSRSFINDTPVNLSVLKQLGEQLVNLHSQHETLALTNTAFQLQLVDAMARHDGLLEDYQKDFLHYIDLKAKLQKLLEKSSLGDKDYLEFQLNELIEANLEEKEQEQLENELSMQEHAEDIKSNLSKVIGILDESDVSVNIQIKEVSSLLRSIQNFHPALEEISNRLESVSIELQDISSEIENIEGSTTVDEERIEEINDRLNILNKLQQKHRVQTVKALIEIRDDFEEKLQSMEKFKEELEDLQQQLNTIQKVLLEKAQQLHINRSGITDEIETEVKQMLEEVGMPNAQFEVKIDELPFEKITTFGLDKITFLFSANKGSRLAEIKHVASGGELSRLMLVLKSLIASSKSMPTLIFDEIDTGISGETAIKVGRLLEKLGKNHQAIIITHLPQIAGIGEQHFFVHKELKNNKTITKIKALDKDERIKEIAKMIGGEKYTDTALKSAKELLVE